MPSLASAVTLLSLAGTPQAHGPFDHTTSALPETHGPGPYTRLGLGATPGHPYGAFTGKASSTSDSRSGALPFAPVVTIGPFTDVEIEDWIELVPRVTLASSVGRSVSSTFTLRPVATMPRAQVSGSSLGRSSAESVVPVVTLAYRLARPQESALTAVPVVTLASSVDTAAIEALSAFSAIPVVTLGVSVSNLYEDRSAGLSAIPVVTLSEQVERVTGQSSWSVTMTLRPRVSLAATARSVGEVDRITLTPIPFGTIRITTV